MERSGLSRSELARQAGHGRHGGADYGIARQAGHGRERLGAVSRGMLGRGLAGSASLGMAR